MAPSDALMQLLLLLLMVVVWLSNYCSHCLAVFHQSLCHSFSSRHFSPTFHGDCSIRRHCEEIGLLAYRSSSLITADYRFVAVIDSNLIRKFFENCSAVPLKWKSIFVAAHWRRL